MRSFRPIFLCFVLVFLVQALANIVPVEQGVHLRGYGGDDSYGSYGSYESSSESSSDSSKSSSSKSSSCELPEPREECPKIDASDAAPLFVAHGTLNWLGEDTRVEPKDICDCDTSAKIFFTDTPDDGSPTSMKDAEDKHKMSYTLNSDRYCPHMCLRDTAGKFWVPKNSVGVGASTVVFITTVCKSGSCVNYAINQGNVLKGETSATERPNPPLMNQPFTSSVYLKVDAISCRGCDLIRKEVTEKCYAIFDS